MIAKMTVSASGSTAHVGSTALAPCVALIQPITGPEIAVEMLPDAPMMASSNAPPDGNRSDVMPSIVGHQNAVPTARSAAATYHIIGVVVWPKRYRPRAASGAVTAM